MGNVHIDAMEEIVIGQIPATPPKNFAGCSHVINTTALPCDMPLSAQPIFPYQE